MPDGGIARYGLNGSNCGRLPVTTGAVGAAVAPQLPVCHHGLYPNATTVSVPWGAEG